MEQLHACAPRPTLKARLEAYERRLIQEALSASGGNKRRAARALGVLPTTLHEKMRRLGLLSRTTEAAPEPAVDSPPLVA